ncbi:MAG: ArsR family transcriptional regulator [Hyphomicrobiales bacterium]|nr:ArsR family transcriptional regulator [Hyphomicrobiales bacterium]
MEKKRAILALAALAQTTRLDVFRALVAAEPTGVAAGDLARRFAVPANTLSAHLNVLAHAGLVKGERKGRSITYRAELAQVRLLLGFMLKDCCGGNPDACGPLLDQIVCCPEKACPS